MPSLNSIIILIIKDVIRKNPLIKKSLLILHSLIILLFVILNVAKGDLGIETESSRYCRIVIPTIMQQALLDIPVWNADRLKKDRINGSVHVKVKMLNGDNMSAYSLLFILNNSIVIIVKIQGKRKSMIV
jgi:hypothetical protein